MVSLSVCVSVCVCVCLSVYPDDVVFFNSLLMPYKAYERHSDSVYLDHYLQVSVVTVWSVCGQCVVGVWSVFLSVSLSVYRDDVLFNSLLMPYKSYERQPDSVYLDHYLQNLPLADSFSLSVQAL